jgi:hypothetical protein
MGVMPLHPVERYTAGIKRSNGDQFTGERAQQ